MGRTFEVGAPFEARAGVEGYCRLVAYLGSHAVGLELDLPPGVQHSAKKTKPYFERVIPMAQPLSAAGHGAQRVEPTEWHNLTARIQWDWHTRLDIAGNHGGQ